MKPMDEQEQIPLAERIRPTSSADVIGQDHLLAEGGAIRHFLDKKRLPSLIFWGPPGVGKTTLAEIICQELDRPFVKLSAIHSGVKDIRAAIEKSKEQNLFKGGRSVLFIDEIHRFSKSQQDSLLEAVEKGYITLIGATTENPSFEVINALLSRCQVYVLKSLDQDALRAMVERALTLDPILSKRNVDMQEFKALIRLSGGDGRKLLNALDLLSTVHPDDPLIITDEMVEEVIAKNLVQYDRSGDQHYDIASALIKSIRGSHIDGSLYWLARMLKGGEDPKFIARRLLISAAEDIGLANPNALLLAESTFAAVERIGMPEARIILSECVIYLASSAKSNSAYRAIDLALETVEQEGSLPVPLHLRNAPTKLTKQLGHGAGYKYPHDFPGNFIPQEYLPDPLKGKRFFEAADNPKERSIAQEQERKWK